MSKFNKIFEARGGGSNSGNENEGEIFEKTEEKNPPKKSKLVRATSKKSKSKPKSAAASEKREQALNTTTGGGLPFSINTPQEGKKRGRPQAKRSDPNYLGFTTYIRRDTHLNAKIALLQEGKGRELSELVETLLTDWLKSKKDS